MKPKFAITCGDPCGIGPEIVIKALAMNPDIYIQCHPIIYGDVTILKTTANMLNYYLNFQVLQDLEIEETNAGTLYCVNISPAPYTPCYGRICAEGGQHAYAYMKNAIEAALHHKVKAIITAPLNKEALKLAQVPYLDHTEILTDLTSSNRSMTLFVTGNLRVFFYSRHIPFRDISAALDKKKIVQTLQDCHHYLEQIGIMKPRLALAALNPHGGEQGMFGSEEVEILIPAVEQAKQLDLQVEGPIPADSVFHLAKEGHYDGVLSLYHDQGHIAAKTLDFHRTVSLTMGLPFLRTSVDHGTAFDIAGKGVASEISMVEAIKAAQKYHW
jgi:4-hydroxythreonine-4-phosphate dehydrogenase